MVRFSPRPAGSAWWRALFAVLCVLLVVLVGTVQVVHFHADRSDSHADCSLCAAAHTVAQGIASYTGAVLLQAAERKEPAAVERRAAQTHDFGLFTRPPPAR